MTGAEIRKLMSDLPGADDVDASPGQKAIRRRAVVGSGADPAEVERWVYANGGRATPAPERIPSGAATWRTEPSREAVAYLVPTDALE